jgi:hypothetical protein
LAGGATDFYQQTVGTATQRSFNESVCKVSVTGARPILLFHQAGGYVLPMSGDRTAPLREMKAVNSTVLAGAGWIAYGSDESGVWKLRRAVSWIHSRRCSRGRAAAWRDASFLSEPDGKLMSATVTSDSRGAIATTAAAELFRPAFTPSQRSIVRRDRDGKRLFIGRVPGSAAAIGRRQLAGDAQQTMTA